MSHKEPSLGTMNVAGEGQVKVQPDVAEIRLAVVTEGKTAAEAVTTNAEAANRVLEAIEKLGVARSDMKTVGLSVYPTYQHDEKTGTSQIVGYRAEDSIAVDAALDLAGKVFDAGVGAGANTSSGISFRLLDERPHREKALEAAVRMAKAEAELVSRAMGVSLLGPRTIEVEQGGGPIVMRSPTMEARVATPVLPGDLTVTARIRVTFEYHL